MKVNKYINDPEVTLVSVVKFNGVLELNRTKDQLTLWFSTQTKCNDSSTVKYIEIN
jgi:hypothetical protein